jgi:hypothetical protein
LRGKKNAGSTGAGVSIFNESQLLAFSDGDGGRGAGFYAAFTAQALIDIGHLGFAVFHFQNPCRTDVNAFFVAGAFVGINLYIPGHSGSPPKIIA